MEPRDHQRPDPAEATPSADSPRRFRFDVAAPADDAEVRRIVRENPMQGEVRVSLEREPSAALAEAVEGDVHHTIVCHDRRTGRLAAVGSAAVRDAYVNGVCARVGFLSKLRVAAGYRNHISILRGGFAFLRELHPSLGATLYVASIFTDNAPARRLFERGLPGLPTFRAVETFETLVMPVRWRPGYGESAGPDHRDLAVEYLARNAPRFQFAPRWRAEDLHSAQFARGLEADDFFCWRGAKNGIGGCIAVWDQRAFKQIVVRGYGPKLTRARPLINLFSKVLGRPQLPEIGGRLNVGYVSHLAVDNDDPELFDDLLADAHARAADRGLAYLALGLSSRHPLLRVAKKRYGGRRSLATLYAVHWDDGAAAADALDGRVAHYEVALL